MLQLQVGGRAAATHALLVLVLVLVLVLFVVLILDLVLVLVLVTQGTTHANTTIADIFFPV